VKRFAAAVLLAALAGCSSAETVDDTYLLEAGALKSVRDPQLASLVRTVASRTTNDSAQRTLSSLLQGHKLEPALDSEGPAPLCESTVVKFRGDTFVILALTPWGVAVPGSSWLRILLFDVSGKLLDQVFGELRSRDGRMELALTDLKKEGRLACLIVAQPGSTVALQHGQNRATLQARAFRSNPVEETLGVVCQVGIRSRKLRLLHPDLSE